MADVEFTLEVFCLTRCGAHGCTSEKMVTLGRYHRGATLPKPSLPSGWGEVMGTPICPAHTVVVAVDDLGSVRFDSNEMKVLRRIASGDVSMSRLIEGGDYARIVFESAGMTEQDGEVFFGKVEDTQ